MSTARERVLVLFLDELANHGRVLRQVEILASRYEVVVAAPGAPPSVPVAFIELPQVDEAPLRRRAASAGRLALRLAGRYESAYWLDARARQYRIALQRALPVDAVVVNHLAALPLARSVAGSAPVVFDAHEHWTSESASWTRLQRASMRGAHEWLVDDHVTRTAGMMTVSPGIARDYHDRVGVTPEVVTNAPFFQELDPSPVSQPFRLLHVGMADERRRLEDTIEAVRSLDERFHLDLVLERDNDYRRRLERLAQAAGARIRILRPVPNADLISFANRYDIGVFLLPARYPNQLHVLPNKLFDYIQARLAIAIGPSPEMAAVVRKWDCGVVAQGFSPAALADALAQLDGARVERMKANAHRAAHVLTADANRESMLSLVDRAIRPPGRE